MPDNPHDPSLEDLLAQLHLALSEPVNFRNTDPATTQAKVRLLTAAATYFNLLALTDFGGRVDPAREAGLVEQVVAAAFQTYGGYDPHHGPFAKAAMLLRGITPGHPFHDANKRTGFLTAAYSLELMGSPLPDDFATGEMETLAMRVSAGELRDLDAIAQELRRLWGGTV